VQGVVRARSVPGGVQVAYGASWWNMSNEHTTFSLLPAESTDLVAVNLRAAESEGAMTDRAIIRRAQTHAAGAQVELDFTAAEAFAPELRTLRWTGPPGFAAVSFSAGGTQYVTLWALFSVPAGDGDAERTVAIPMLPSGRTAPGDLHRVLMLGDGRTVMLYTREPRDLAVRFGPRAGAPTLSEPVSAPYRRFVAEVVSHPDYDASVSVFFSQCCPEATSVMLTATREYFGGRPATWRLPIPDFRGVPQFPVAVAPRPGSMYWTLMLSSRPGPMYWQGFAPTDGLLIRTALSVGELR
jgi:hypothetical protein